MTIPTSEPILPEEKPLPPARKRRQQRIITPQSSSEERAAYLHELSHRVTPSVDFYLFNLLAAAVLFLAILLDAPALYILTVLLAPFMVPVVGMSLAVAMGSLRFFLRSFIVTLIGGAIFFLSGLAAGVIAHRLVDWSLLQVSDHSVFSWPDLLVLTLGACLTALLLVRSRQKPLVASVALVYELYVPLGMAGFGLSSGRAGLFPDGLLVFGVHLAWAILIGTITLAFAGFKPRKIFGFGLALLLTLAALLSVLWITGIGSSFLLPRAQTTEAPEPTLPLIDTPQVAAISPAPADTLPPAPSNPTASSTPAPQSATATRTLQPSPTPTETLTPLPTPVWAKIHAEQGGGAYVRAEPSYDSRSLTSLLNDSIVQVISAPVNTDGVFWVNIRTATGIEGWVVQYLLRTATPAPGW